MFVYLTVCFSTFTSNAHCISYCLILDIHINAYFTVHAGIIFLWLLASTQGFPVNRRIEMAIVRRYADRDDKIRLQDFIIIICKLTLMHRESSMVLMFENFQQFIIACIIHEEYISLSEQSIDV